MDISTIKTGFTDGERKFHEYLAFCGSALELQERINRIFDYLGANNMEILSFMLGQAAPLLETFSPGHLKSQAMGKSSDELKTMMKILLVMLDSMNYIGYIDINYLPKEMRSRKPTQPFNMEFPKAMVDKVSEDNKKKKKNVRK
jgi:hypothetical protein